MAVPCSCNPDLSWSLPIPYKRVSSNPYFMLYHLLVPVFTCAVFGSVSCGLWDKKLNAFLDFLKNSPTRQKRLSSILLKIWGKGRSHNTAWQVNKLNFQIRHFCSFPFFCPLPHPLATKKSFSLAVYPCEFWGFCCFLFLLSLPDCSMGTSIFHPSMQNNAVSPNSRSQTWMSKHINDLTRWWWWWKNKTSQKAKNKVVIPLLFI